MVFGAMACREGAIKYGAFNWREKDIRLSEYIGAIRRHTAALSDGEWIDPDSGLPHLAKILATAAIVLDADRAGTLIVDTPAGAHASDLIRELNKGIADGKFDPKIV